jgi:hypothetical protein
MGARLCGSSIIRLRWLREQSEQRRLVLADYLP